MKTMRNTSSGKSCMKRWQSEWRNHKTPSGIVLYTVILFMIISGQDIFSQGVGISEVSIVPHSSAILELKSTVRGLLAPRMTTAERNAIATPAEGLLIYNTDTNAFNYYNGVSWIAILNTGTGVTSVSGTVNRISVSGTSTPVIDIDANYTGQTSITTLGTIGTGTWNGTTIDIANGGTGATDASTARTNLGLGNVDNTSDANKPISTATAAALALKSNIASPTFTGTVTIPTLDLSSTSNQLVMQSAGVSGTLTWTPTLSNKLLTLPDATGTLALTSDITSGTTTNFSGNLSGDVTGTQTATKVDKINGTTVNTAGGSLTTGTILRVTGASAVDYGALDLSNTNAITGILPVANGGTGATTQQAAINALTGAQVNGRYLRSDGTNATLSTIPAAEVVNTASGNIVATNVQDAINELDGDKTAANAAIVGSTKTKITYDTKGLVTAGADATATDIVNTASGNISSATVQGALNELDAEKVIGNAAITGGQKTKITYDTKGLVTSGTDATGSDILNVAAGNIASTNVQDAINELDGDKTAANAAIVGSTKTKITYDTKGLVTAGADATTADIASTLDKRYVTDADLIVIGNTSGTNTGDNSINTTSNTYADGKVADVINDGTTTVAPSQNSVYDALALKAANNQTFYLGTTQIAINRASAAQSLTGITGIDGNAATATTSTNLSGGSGGSIPYQSAANTTALLANGSAGQVLTSAGTTLPPAWATPTNGTVTTLSVSSANGFAGSVTNPSTTPAITLSTSVTGLLKGDGTTMSAATSGVDYEVPLTFSTGLTRTTNTITVNTSQNITKLNNLTSNGIVNTSGGDGTLGIISTTGTGDIVRANSPSLITPSLGAATATSINGNTITSGTGTLTIASGKTLTVNNSLTFSGTDATTMTFPSTSASIARTDAAQTFTGVQTLSSSPVLSSLTIGSIPFIGTGKVLSEDNANLFWDNGNHRLGIGTTSPTAPLDVRGDVAVTATGSSTGTPRNIGFYNWNTGNAARFTFGDAWNTLQNAYGYRMQIVSYHGVDISGSRGVETPLGFVTGAASDASLNVIGTRAANPVLTVTGASSQTGNLQEWKNSTGSVLASINSSGAITASNLSGTNTGDQTNITGNAGTATTLASSRSIYGNSFNGSADLTQVITSAYGGTGNGFTEFSGPASTKKTFILPNASATILTSNAPVTVGQGGTGATDASTARTNLGLGNVENTAISSWAGSSNITTLGTISAGTWNGTTITIANGGTGATTKAAAFDALSPMNAQGDIIYGGASGTGTRLAKGTEGQVLAMNSGASAPVWTSPATNEVQSLNPSSITWTSVRLLQLNGTTGVSITPSKSGKILIILTGNAKLSGTATMFAQLYYNTSYASGPDTTPASEGFTALGTRMAVATNTTLRAFTLSSTVTLSIGTTYYFDLGIYSTSNTATVTNVNVSIVEL